MKSKTKLNIILCLILALFASNLTALSTIVAEISQTGKAVVDGGLFLSAHFLGFITFAVIGGILAERIGKKIIVAAALVGYFLLLTVFPLLFEQTLVYVIVFLVGGCGGILECLTSAMVSDNNADNPNYYVNVSHIFFGAGAICGPIAVTALLTYIHTPTMFYWILAGGSLLLSIALMRQTFTEPAKPDSSPRTRPGSMVYLTPGFLCVCMAIFCYTGAEIASWSWLSYKLQSFNNMTALQSAFAVALFWTALTIGRFICGKLLSYMKISSLIIMLGVCSAAVTVVSVYTNTLITAYIAVILLGLSCSSIFPFLSSYGSSMIPTGSGISFTILVVCGNIGSSLLTFLVGRINTSFGNTIKTIFLAVTFLLVAVFTRLSQRFNK